MSAQYWMADCPVHGRTTFGAYYLTTQMLEYGCLMCHWEDCPACLPKGAPLHSELIADAQEAAHE